MTDKITKAWDYFFNGVYEKAYQLVKNDFQLENCNDYNFLNLMGYLNLQFENYEQSSAIFNKYIQLARKQNQVEFLHIGLHQLAMVYREAGKFKEALELIEEEKKVLDKHFKADLLINAVNNYEQGFLRLKLGKLDEALQYMQLSLKQALATEDLIAQACAYRGLGDIYLTLKQIDRSSTNYHKARDLFEKAEDEIGIKEVKVKIGELPV